MHPTRLVLNENQIFIFENSSTMPSIKLISISGLNSIRNYEKCSLYFWFDLSFPLPTDEQTQFLVSTICKKKINIVKGHPCYKPYISLIQSVVFVIFPSYCITFLESAATLIVIFSIAMTQKHLFLISIVHILTIIGSITALTNFKFSMSVVSST